MNEPRITDNREAWAKKVLAQSVPEHEVDTALDICMDKAIKEGGWLRHLKPRLIASNWNKPVQKD